MFGGWNSSHQKNVLTRTSTTNVQITFENIVAILSDKKYDAGIERSSIINMLSDVFNYVSGDQNVRIACPVPMLDLNDRHQVIWGEGAKVSSRSRSGVPKVSYTSDRRPSLSSSAMRGERDAIKRAYSVTSSSGYSSRYVGIAEDSEDEYTPSASVHQRPNSKRDSYVRADRYNPVRVGGSIVRPTPSIERMFNTNNVAMFDDEPEIEVDAVRPVVNKHSKVPERKSGKQSRVGFGDA